MRNNNFSVLMSVYYKEKPDFLDKSLDSIFTQTKIPNEVVLVEDGKLTPELDKIINKYKKKYKKIMRVIEFSENRGLGKALHDGLIECKNEIVFRMDSDDISMPNRFEKTLEIFNKFEPDVVGSNIVEYDEEMKNITGYRKLPCTDDEIKKMLPRRNPMNHMTVAYKKSKVINAGNYLDMQYFEDYYLWARMSKNNTFYNIQENLVKVRGGNDMIKRRGGRKYIKPILQFQKELLKLRVISFGTYLSNIIIRIGICILPDKLRYKFYMKKLRDC